MVPILALPLALALQTPCPGWSEDFHAAGTSAPVNAIVAHDDGSGPALYFGGAFATAGDALASGVVRWNGSTFSPLGSGLDLGASGSVATLAVLDLGSGPRLYAGGSFAAAGGQAATGVASWNGTSWDTLGGGPAGGSAISIRALAVFDDGGGPKLYAGGTEASTGDVLPAVWRYDGASWTLLANGPAALCPPMDPICTPAGSVEALAVFDDGAGADLYVGGNFEAAGGMPAFNFARWDGAGWSVPNGTGIGTATSIVSALRVHDDGSGAALFVAGALGAAMPHASLVRWNGTSFSAVGFGAPAGLHRLTVLPPVEGLLTALWAVSGSTTLSAWDGVTWWPLALPTFVATPSFQAVGALDTGTGARLVLGGAFLGASPGAANVARRDAGAWLALADGDGLTGGSGSAGGAVNALCVHDRGSGPELYAAGSFGGTSGRNLSAAARWDGASWASIPTLAQGNSRPVRALASVDTGSGLELWLAGDMQRNLNGMGSFHSFLVWDGTTLADVAGAPNPFQEEGLDFAVFDAGLGPVLYAATEGRVLRWDGASLATFVDPSGDVRGLAVHDDGSGPALYVHGRFTSIGGVQALNVARWNGSAWSAVGGGLTLALVFPQAVECLLSFDDGAGAKLYAGGTIASASGVALSNLAVWDGIAWNDVGGGVAGPSASVFALAAHDDGTGAGRALAVGGRFTSAGGLAASGLALWDGVAWRTDDVRAGGRTPVVRALASVELASLGARRLAVGGEFESLGVEPSARFALRSTCDLTGELGCFGDGTAGAACPCGNASASNARAGCLSSQAQGGTLRARGRASLLDDTVVLTGANMRSSSVLYYQGASSLAGVVAGDGVRCVGGPFVRLATRTNVGGTSSYPQPGGLALSVRGAVLAPGTRHYAAHYRNAAAFCTIETFNYTNAVTLVWEP